MDNQLNEDSKMHLHNAFQLSIKAGVRFSTLLSNHINYAGYKTSDVAAIAESSLGQVKASIQDTSPPTIAIRQAMEECLGFDPWKIKQANIVANNILSAEDSKLLRELRNDDDTGYINE